MQRNGKNSKRRFLNACNFSLTWNDITDKSHSVFAGWTIEIFGDKDIVDISSTCFEWKRTAPYQALCEKVEGKSIIVGTGPFTWILTPEKDAKLGKEMGEAGRTRSRSVLNQVKSKLEKMGFLSAQVGPITMGPKRNETVMYIWTFTKGKETKTLET